MHTFRFYIGTHASAGQNSLCLCEADFSAGTFSTLRTMRELSDPTYLALSSQKVLYALSRSGSKGSVNAIREHAIVSTLPSGGSGPCHICVDDRGEFLLCANYGSGGFTENHLANTFIHFDENGNAAIGWTDIDGKRYFFNDEGVMHIGVYNDDGTIYYLGRNGIEENKWVTVENGKTYYCDYDGTMVEGWHNVNGNYYYFYPGSGQMAANAYIGEYYVNNDGIMQ